MTKSRTKSGVPQGFSRKIDDAPSRQALLNLTSPFRNGYQNTVGSKTVKPVELLPGVGKFTDARGKEMYCRLDTEQVIWGDLAAAKTYSKEFVRIQKMRATREAHAQADHDE